MVEEKLRLGVKRTRRGWVVSVVVGYSPVGRVLYSWEQLALHGITVETNPESPAGVYEGGSCFPSQHITFADWLFDNIEPTRVLRQS